MRDNPRAQGYTVDEVRHMGVKSLARADCMVLLRHWHALRHEFLHHCYYAETTQATRLAMDRIRVLVCTYAGSRILGLLCDGYQGQSIENLASLLAYAFVWH